VEWRLVSSACSRGRSIEKETCGYMCEGFQWGPKEPFRLGNWKIQRPGGQRTLLRWGSALGGIRSNNFCFL
jgi:hypothetical protein